MSSVFNWSSILLFYSSSSVDTIISLKNSYFISLLPCASISFNSLPFNSMKYFLVLKDYSLPLKIGSLGYCLGIFSQFSLFL